MEVKLTAPLVLAFKTKQQALTDIFNKEVEKLQEQVTLELRRWMVESIVAPFYPELRLEKLVLNFDEESVTLVVLEE